jgi:hypothetical protein
MSNYLTTTTASSTYQTIANMSNYLTTTTASSTYQTIANMTNYLTTTTASSTYQTIANMSNYLTTATASSTYLTTTSASSTYQTIANMSNYLTTTTASSTYQTIANMSNYIDLTTTQSISGQKTYSGNVIINSQYVSKCGPTLFTSANTLSGNFYQSYSISATTAFTITLPLITASSVGQRILFRRTGGTSTIIISFVGDGIQLIYNTALTGQATANPLMGSGVYKVEFISGIVNATPTYAWFQI